MSSAPQFNPASPAQAEPPVRRRHLPAWAVAILLGVITLVLYWPATHYDFINYDDADYVTDNMHVRTGLTLKNIAWAFSSSVTGNWHPLTMISHMLDCQLFGLKPGGHHLTSGLCHALNTALVFLWLRGLTGAVWRSALVAALFGWHPLDVQSVAWIAERKNVLSLGFGLLALIFYTAYARQSMTGKSTGCARSYWTAWFCLALGLMCKSILVTWPMVFFLLDYWPLARFQSISPWALIKEKIPGFALVAAVSLVTVLTHEREGDLLAVGRLSVGARLENTLISYGRYLGKIFWPTDLAIYYPYPGHWPMGEVLLTALFLASVTLMVVLARRRQPFLLMGWLWFLGTLVPVIGLLQVGSQAMADRHAYIPSLGIWIMTVWGVYELTNRGRVARAVLAGAGLAALIFCFAATRQQLAYWQNSETLFREALAVTRNNYIAHGNLGMALNQAGRTDEAITQFREALDLRADDALVRNDLAGALARKGRNDEALSQFREVIRREPGYADAHFDLANFLVAQGRTAEALEEFQADLRLKPEDADGHYDYGNALLEQGQPEAAIGEFQAAFRLKEYDAGVHYNLGNLLAQKGQIDAAVSEFKEAIRRKPDDADAHNNLGNLLAKAGQTDAAIEELKAALQIKPEDADTHYNLGYAYLKTGRLDDTISQFQEAIRLKPGYAPSHYNLAVTLNKQGRADAAIGEFEEAIRLEPDYAIAHNSLGAVLAAQGRLDEAISEFQAALRIKPDYANAQNNLARARALKNK